MKKIFTLIAAVAMTVCANAVEVVTDYSIDWSTMSAFTNWTGGKGTITVDADGLHVANDEVQTNFWDLQFHLANDINLEEGVTYKVVVEAKAEGTGAANVRYKLGGWSAGAEGNFMVATSDEYKEYTLTCDAKTGSGSFLLVQFGDYVGTVSFRKITITHEVYPSDTDWMLQVDLSAAQANPWDSQVIIQLPEAMEVDKKYDVFFSVKGSVDSTEGLGAVIEDNKSSNKDQYGNSADLIYTAPFNVTTSWNEVTIGQTDGKYPYDRIILNIGKYEGTLCFDNFRVVEIGGDKVITVDFANGISAASKRSWHNHVTISKVASDLDNTATAIENVNVVRNDMMYNLAGQRINKANGLYIVNGKKYVK